MRRGLLLLLTLAFVLLGADAGARLRSRKKKTAKAPPPIAFYLAEWESKSATAEQAIAKCKAKRVKQQQAHPELGRYQDRKSCEASIITVRGPYTRAPDKYEDHKVYVYRGSDGVWYDANGETSCFVEGTPIATPAGDVAIETLKQGDLVWSWDADAKRRVPGLVERTKRRLTTSLVTIATAEGSVTATPNHPFFVLGAKTYVEAEKLSAGDMLLRADKSSGITSVTARDATSETIVIDITVSPHRNYFAGGLLVHNY